VTERQGLAELVTREKTRCILAMAPVGALGSDRARFRDPTGTIVATIAFAQVLTSLILRILDPVRWPRG
jgi:hypothetical protein